MRYLAGYVGCVAFFLLLMGLVFYAFVLPTVKPRKKHFLEWVMIAVFGFGMFNSMATKPGSGGPSPSPRRSPPQQTPTPPSDDAEGVTPTNTPPWECALAFCRIEKSPTNVQLTAAWPLGFYDYAPTFDLFIAQPGLTNDWRWIAWQTALSSATNCEFTVTPSLLGLSELPFALFARVTERNEACSVMGDFDNDGVPNPYELYHGTNPYLDDANLIDKMIVGPDSSYQTLTAALQASEPYAIIQLRTNELVTAQQIVLPEHPVLIEGPQNGYTVIKSAADLGAFMFKDGQGSHTLVRNIYLDLLKRGSFQVGFWCGGNLPWEGLGASPTFENVVVRTPRSETEYIGWLFYGNNGETAMLRNCVVNALGATNVRGVETGNGPSVDLDDCSFLNFPSNGSPTLSRTFTLGNDGTTNAIVRQGGEATVFVDLTPGVDSDGDGYTNVEEVECLGTDPWLDDTDGDGVTDLDEIATGTDPLNAYSFQQTILIHVTNTTDLAGSSVFVSWHCEGEGSVATSITNSFARSFDVTMPRPDVDEQLVVFAFRDLNGNGRFDEDFDMAQSTTVLLVNETVRITFAFGDVDRDGVSDYQERVDGSDPYSAQSFRIRRTVNLENQDVFVGVTNYVAQGLTKEWSANEPSHPLIGHSETLSVDTNAVSGYIYVKCYRDFNQNGVYDKDSEPLYVYSVSNRKDKESEVLSAIFKDKDGDKVPDSIEWSEGTSVIDSRCYCYAPRIMVTGIFSTTNQLYAQPFFGTNALAVAHLVCTNQEEYVPDHLSTTNAERFVVKYWDDLNGNLMIDDGEAYSIATVNPNGHVTTLVYDLPYSKFDANNNKMPDWWEIATGLSANLTVCNWYDDTDNDGLINLHEYWTGCDPHVPDGSNTVLSILARSIDDRLSDDPAGRMAIYNNYYSAALDPNTNCWAYGIDLSCASPYNSAGGVHQAGTLISDQHIVLAAHYQYATNTQVHFKDANGTSVVRTVIARATVPNTDICINLLDEPVPPSFHPAKLLPTDFYEYIGDGRGLPILSLDQEEHAIVADLSSLPAQKDDSRGSSPNSPMRIDYYEPIVDKDSGNPCFLVYNDELVILHTFYSGGGGSGPFLTSYAEEVQATMDWLSTANGKSNKQLSFMDFSNHNQIVQEVK